MKYLIILLILVMFQHEGKASLKNKPYYIWVVSTAYCPCKICCGDHANGKTSENRDASLAGVAVDPKVIPMGSRIDIPNYNRGPNKNGSWILADDKGGAIKGYRIDIRFNDHKTAKKWGVKKIRIRIHPKK